MFDEFHLDKSARSDLAVHLVSKAWSSRSHSSPCDPSFLNSSPILKKFHHYIFPVANIETIYEPNLHFYFK